jgi:hypothetical protein
VNSGRTLTYSGGALHVGKQMDLLGTLDFANGSPTLTIDDGASAFLSAGTIINSHNATLVGGVNSFINLPAGTDVATDFAAVISQGTVHVDGHPLTIESGKTVGGTGSIVGDVTNSGELSPGHSPGSLAITGDLTEAADGTMKLEIAGRDAGQFDVITATGDVTLGGTLVVKLLDGFVPNASDSFVMVTGGTLSGEFANAPGRVATDGGMFDVVYGANSLTLTGFTATAVPEPGAIAVLGLGAVGLLRRRRR